MQLHVDRPQVRPGTVASIVVAGDVDVASAPELSDALSTFLDDVSLTTPMPPGVHLDLSGVTFLDSSGLKALLSARRRSDHLGLSFTTNASRAVRRVLDVTGVSDLFPPSD